MFVQSKNQFLPFSHVSLQQVKKAQAKQSNSNDERRRTNENEWINIIVSRASSFTTKSSPEHGRRRMVSRHLFRYPGQLGPDPGDREWRLLPPPHAQGAPHPGGDVPVHPDSSERGRDSLRHRVQAERNDAHGPPHARLRMRGARIRRWRLQLRRDGRQTARWVRVMSLTFIKTLRVINWTDKYMDGFSYVFFVIPYNAMAHTYQMYNFYRLSQLKYCRRSILNRTLLIFFVRFIHLPF